MCDSCVSFGAQALIFWRVLFEEVTADILYRDMDTSFVNISNSSVEAASHDDDTNLESSVLYVEQVSNLS